MLTFVISKSNLFLWFGICSSLIKQYQIKQQGIYFRQRAGLTQLNLVLWNLLVRTSDVRIPMLEVMLAPSHLQLNDAFGTNCVYKWILSSTHSRAFW